MPFGDFSILSQSLTVISLPSFSEYTKRSSLYIKLGLYDKAVEWIWRDYEHYCKNAKHYNKKERVEAPLLRGRTFQFFGESMDVKGHMNYLELPIYEALWEHPRYIELLEKIKSSDNIFL